jgi:hypothetical protein
MTIMRTNAHQAPSSMDARLEAGVAGQLAD